MVMDGGAVLGVITSGGTKGSLPGPIEGRVHREEEIARSARAQLVGDLEPHRTVAFGHDQGSQIMRRWCRTGAEVNITPEFGGFGQVRMHLFRIIHDADLVIIGTRVRGFIRHRNRNILPQVVGAGWG